MGRLTLRLPQSLHADIAAEAKREGVSLNQYIVFALTRQVAKDYDVIAHSERQLAEQRAEYAALRDGLAAGSSQEIQAILDQRDQVQTDDPLTRAILERVQRQIRPE
jgi:hypothetical protein